MVPVGLFFPRGSDALRAHIEGADLTAWRPRFVVLHNTGAPTLAERPHGLSKAHIDNLAAYYTGLGWHAGPHFFVDQNGVWAFSPMCEPGVHSPSWNEVSWGVEMLGDYEEEDFRSGDGALVATNTMHLLALLHKKAGLDSTTLRFHRQDPKTTHKDCPGKSVEEMSVRRRLHDLLVILGGNQNVLQMA